MTKVRAEAAAEATNNQNNNNNKTNRQTVKINKNIYKIMEKSDAVGQLLPQAADN